MRIQRSIRKDYVLTCTIMVLIATENGQNFEQNNTFHNVQRISTKRCAKAHLENITSCRILAILEKNECIKLQLDNSSVEFIKNCAESSLADPSSHILDHRNKKYAALAASNKSVADSLTSRPPTGTKSVRDKCKLESQLQGFLSYLEEKVNICSLKTKEVIKVIDPCSKRSIRVTAFGITFILLMIIGICGNATVLAVITTNNQLRSEVINWFLLSLAASDMLVCSSILPFRVHQSFHNQFSCLTVKQCYAVIYADLISSISSIICLVYISINRYLAVSHPLTHYSFISRKTTVYMLILCWFSSIILSIIPTVNWKTLELSITLRKQKCFNSKNDTATNFFLTVVIICPLFVMGILYLKIIGFLKQRREEFEDQERIRQMQHTEWKVTKTVALVYGVFFISYLPTYVINITGQVCPPCFETFYQKCPEIYFILTRILPLLSSVANPFIYVVTGEKYRKALSQMCTSRKRKAKYQRHQPNSHKEEAAIFQGGISNETSL